MKTLRFSFSIWAARGVASVFGIRVTKFMILEAMAALLMI